MERLSGLDATFLYLETPSLHMHVSMAAIFDPTTVPGGYSFEKLRDLVSSRLALAPIFSRRLVEVPFRLGHPCWVDDPSFDIDYHMRRAALPSPGGMDELSQFVGDVCSRQLDRSKPLWEMHIVEGLQGGNIAMVSKIHHCTIDGVSGAELLAQLFDLEPGPARQAVDVKETDATDATDATAAKTGTQKPGNRLPSDVQLVAQALAARLVRPVGIARLAWRTGRAVLDVRRVRQSGGSGRAALPLTAPRTSLNASVTPHRRVAFSTISLDDVKRIKRACDTTVNDVVLAVCTGALRRYLLDGDELPGDPLVATVPVSVAPKVGNRPGANKVSAMFVPLPSHIEDPVERLSTIRDSTRGAKEEHNALGADVLLNWAEHATPNVFSTAARAYTRLRLAERHRPIHNLVISNVPGPDFPLYLAGAELVAGFPLGPVMDGAGVNITVMSYRGILNWGLIACAETVPRLKALASYIPEALDELLRATHLDPATPVGVAPPHVRRRRTTRSTNGAATAGSATSAPEGSAPSGSPTPAPAPATPVASSAATPTPG